MLTKRPREIAVLLALLVLLPYRQGPKLWRDATHRAVRHRMQAQINVFDCCTPAWRRCMRSLTSTAMALPTSRPSTSCRTRCPRC